MRAHPALCTVPAALLAAALSVSAHAQQPDDAANGPRPEGAVAMAELVEPPADATGVEETVVEEPADLPPAPWADAFERFAWYGEELIYNIEIWGAPAARAALSIGYPYVHETLGTVVPVQGLATALGLFQAVYPMHDSGMTYLHPADMRPVQSSKRLEERGVLREYTVDFDPQSYRGEVLRVRDDQQQRYRRWLPAGTYDAFAWILEMRTADLSVGATAQWYVFDGWKLSRITTVVTGHDHVYTDLGYIEAAEMTFTREVLNSFQPLPWADEITSLPPAMTITDGPYALGKGWVSLDDRRLPLGVEIEAPAPLGAIRLMLASHTPPDASFTPDPALAALPR